MARIDEVRELHLKGKTDSEIAREIGISRERVRQLRVKLGVPRNVKLSNRCFDCGKPMRAGRKRCPECHQAFKDAQWASMRCDNCGKEYVIRASRARAKSKKGSKYDFCSKRCQGLYAASHWGFIRRPPPRKYTCPVCGNKMRRAGPSFFRKGDQARVRYTHCDCGAKARIIIRPDGMEVELRAEAGPGGI
jgi:predicted RNA-binding Zn-ribbon protein involved in translation (DUF1610 family)